MNNSTLERVRRGIKKAGLDEESVIEFLVDDVLTSKEEEASCINNDGLASQLAYLTNDEDEDSVLEYLERTLDEMKKRGRTP